MLDEKARVKRFYEVLGWSKNDKGQFEDTVRFVDLRDIPEEYSGKCDARLGRHLPETGTYLLDAASGPVPHDVYVAYSKGYEKRVCVDLSHNALTQARQRLGSHGLYVVGDITNLPLRDDAIDAAVSLHTVYHVPADEQRAAFDELHRVITPNGKALVVYTYSWHAPMIKALRFPLRVRDYLLRRFRRYVLRVAPDSPPPQPAQTASADNLYFHAHPPGWFRNQHWSYPIEIRAWRSWGMEMMQAYIHRPLAGRAILTLSFWLESTFPRLMGRIGMYPMIVVKK
jgi:SAM-dependent methyltransferase